ncbi:hypothetical protein ACP4OV_031484 [Aristida adscensionis]
MRRRTWRAAHVMERVLAAVGADATLIELDAGAADELAAAAGAVPAGRSSIGGGLEGLMPRLR